MPEYELDGGIESLCLEILKGPIRSILVLHYIINQKPLIIELIFIDNHNGCTLFWVKFGHAFAYFVVSVY